MITVSENAKQHALDLISDENSPKETVMLVELDGGGCSSFT